jgi:Ca-activated chloride channel homolog
LPRKIIFSILMCLFIFMGPFKGYGKTIAGLIKEGNSAYNAGAYDKAVSAYDEALKEDPESPYTCFNKGAALYRKGDYSGAAEAFEKAALNSKDKQLEAKSKFNLGNSTYKEAEGQKDKDLQKAFEGCSKSVSHYQEALSLDPGMKEAAENMEMVRLVMKNILEEIKKQQENGKKDQEKNEGELKEALDSQQKAGNNGTGQENKDQQDQQQGQQQASSNEERKAGGEQEQSAQAQLSDDAKDILKDEKENKSQRKAIMLRSYKEVDKDW